MLKKVFVLLFSLLFLIGMVFILPLFEPEEYELRIDIEGEGNTSPPEGNYSFEAGEEVRIMAVPEERWFFSNWTGDVPSDWEKRPELVVVMDGDKNITANFQEITLWDQEDFLISR